MNSKVIFEIYQNHKLIEYIKYSMLKTWCLNHIWTCLLWLTFITWQVFKTTNYREMGRLYVCVYCAIDSWISGLRVFILPISRSFVVHSWFQNRFDLCCTTVVSATKVFYCVVCTSCLLFRYVVDDVREHRKFEMYLQSFCACVCVCFASVLHRPECSVRCLQ